MVSYTQQEMVGVTELSKSLSGFIDKVASNAIEKLAVIKHNKPEVIILSIAENERMKELRDYLEDMEIAKIIQERVLDKTEPIKMLTENDLQEYLQKRGIKNVQH